MKDNLIKVWNHVKKHGWAYFWVMWFGVSTYNITNIVIKVNDRQEVQLKAARQETAELREKINNHLIAEGFYNKPAKDVLPVMKEFGIGL